MNWLVFHIVSGQAFFSGIAFLLLAAALATKSKQRIKRFSFVTFLIGVLAAIPYGYYAFASLVSLAWIVSFIRQKKRLWSTTLFVAVWVIAALIELPYHFVPSISAVPTRSLSIIGDSVTAGIGGDERSETWPKILAREHDLVIQDISHIGDTAASARKRAASAGINSPLVIVEIGGNDLLGSTSSSQFARDLDSLLSFLSAPGRQVVMFELPLPPLSHEYGRIQRQLSRRYGVKLIPKRVILSVVAGSDSTLDTVHLSQQGHIKMANFVWRIVGTAFPEKS